LTESLLLAGVSGALGVVVAKTSLPAVLALLPTGRGIPRMEEAQLDWAVLAFTFGVSLVTGVLFGLAPAWRAALAPLSETLKEGGRGSGVSRGSRRFGNLLIAGEVALSLVLLSGAGLLLRSFWLLHQVDSGIDTEKAVAMNVTVPDHRYGTYETGGPNPRRAALFRELERQIAELPGVESSAVASHLPLKHGPNPWGISIEGRGAPPEAVRDGTAVTSRRGLFHHGSISIERVSPGYFRTLGIPLVRGRYLDRRDSARAAGDRGQRDVRSEVLPGRGPDRATDHGRHDQLLSENDHRGRRR
jgi:hypothetical protein